MNLQQHLHPPRLSVAVRGGKISIAPCGHQEDVLQLQATTNLLLYCQRCERGYDGQLMVA